MAKTQSLAHLAAALRDGLQGRARLPRLLATVLLADFFNYSIAQGGLAQLLHNARGEYLQEIGDMLTLTKAPVACRYFEQAIQLCAAASSEYQEFLAADSGRDSAIKNSLNRLSIEYFREGSGFESEAARFIEAAGKPVEAWTSELRAQSVQRQT